MADRLRAILSAAYPPDWIVICIDRWDQRTVPLANLASAVDPGRVVSVLIPPLPGASSFQALQDVIAHLRAPDGCPWDQALTWAKLRATLLEETYELLAALDADDAGKVAEEQGDLLVQIAMQAQIAAEEGRFRMPEVIELIVDKLIRRHPHVFGDAVVSGTEEVLAELGSDQACGTAAKRRGALAPGRSAVRHCRRSAQADAYLDRMSRLREDGRSGGAVGQAGCVGAGRCSDRRDVRRSSLRPGGLGTGPRRRRRKRPEAGERAVCGACGSGRSRVGQLRIVGCGELRTVRTSSGRARTRRIGRDSEGR